MKSLVNRARTTASVQALQILSAGTARLLVECADALEAKDAEIARLAADLAALRAAVGELGYYGHNDWCGCRDEPPKQCECHIHRNNATRAKARKAARGAE